MPKIVKDPMNEKEPAEEEIQIVYAGIRRQIGSGGIDHAYYVIGETQEKTFSRKLQKTHRIGLIFPATRKGSTYTTSLKDEPVGMYEDKVRVAKWMDSNADVERYRAAKNDERRVAKTAREAVKPLRRMYQRANYVQRQAIIEAIVKELTAIR